MENRNEYFAEVIRKVGESANATAQQWADTAKTNNSNLYEGGRRDAIFAVSSYCDHMRPEGKSEDEAEQEALYRYYENRKEELFHEILKWLTHEYQYHDDVQHVAPKLEYQGYLDQINEYILMFNEALQGIKK